MLGKIFNVLLGIYEAGKYRKQAVTVGGNWLEGKQKYYFSITVSKEPL